MPHLQTTHVGSLPRSQPVVDFLFARERGEDYDPATALLQNSRREGFPSRIHAVRRSP